MEQTALSSILIELLYHKSWLKMQEGVLEAKMQEGVLEGAMTYFSNSLAFVCKKMESLLKLYFQNKS